MLKKIFLLLCVPGATLQNEFLQAGFVIGQLAMFLISCWLLQTSCSSLYQEQRLPKSGIFEPEKIEVQMLTNHANCHLVQCLLSKDPYLGLDLLTRF